MTESPPRSESSRARQAAGDAADRRRPALLVVVDTEEEFDWAAPFDRQAIATSHVEQVDRVQAIFDRYGLCPTYVCGYPVATQPQAYGALRAIADDRRALIGAHLHPWVSPPFDEPVTRRNSYPGNLPRGLERRKLEVLTGALERAFGERPIIYKAGRYGVGPNTYAILRELGYRIDLSPAPPMDYAFEGGPDFSAFDCRPHWDGEDHRLFVIPCTGALVGAAGTSGIAPALYRATRRPPLRHLRLPGVLSWLGVLDAIRLTPEGYTLRDLEHLTRVLLTRALGLFVLTFHLPSVVPGHTPYVRTAADLEALLGTIEAYFRLFFEELGGVPTDPLQAREAALDAVFRTGGVGRDTIFSEAPGAPD